MRTAEAQPKARVRAAGGMLAPLVILAAACGSSSETITAPAQVRCATSAQVDPASFPPDGGSGTLRVTTARECTWSVRTDASWIALASGASRQGDGAVEFKVASNESPEARSAALVINDQSPQVSQQGRPCEFTLSSDRESVPASGGERTIGVDATSPQCGWTATANAPWITILSGAEGRGEGDVTFRVDPGAGPRTGTLTIAGESVQVEQGTACTLSVSPQSLNFPAAGGEENVTVTANAGCAWRAEADEPWVTVLGGQGSGSGTFRVRVSSTTEPTRSATLTVGGQQIRVEQGAGCTFAVSPQSLSFPAAGGEETVTVTASSAQCSWSAAADQPWVTIVGGEGRGSGAIRARVAATTGPPRSASVTVAGHTIRIQQGSGCAVTLNPSNAAIPAPGGSAAVQVATGAGCAWMARAREPWITVASGAQGSGPGRVGLTIASNSGPERSGTVSVGGQPFTVTQASGCTYSIAPSSMDLSGFSTTSAIGVSTNAGCPWTARSEEGWITLSAASGSGPAEVRFTAAANNSPERSGTIRIAGHVFTVNQASLCTYILLPPFHDFDADGGNGNVLVIVSGPCTWTAVSSASWIRMTAGTSGTGNGLVQFVASPNTGAARTGFITIAGQQYRVSQGAR